MEREACGAGVERVWTVDRVWRGCKEGVDREGHGEGVGRGEGVRQVWSRCGAGVERGEDANGGYFVQCFNVWIKG